MEMPAKQAATASSEIVKLIRKLRWVGLEEKAQQLEQELERHAVTDTVVSIALLDDFVQFAAGLFASKTPERTGGRN